MVQLKNNPIDENQKRYFPDSHGLQIPVTDMNKDKYIDWLVERRFNWSVEQQTKFLLNFADENERHGFANISYLK
ncbi:hypothetical protein WR25_24006 [Diploscapter pachys]|uniref:Uncharacterized protein n=1 Tax=Diploscapter pachys TaxID=2018661 RepID=A0A2A2M5J9_9BILA|nr:hypothetical protein WR25_24006 [Diploscapter pachys]